MHAARLNSSPRLDRVYDLLVSGAEYTTREIMRKAHVCAVNSCISELRANGCKINCRQTGRRWYYRMES